MPHGAYKVLALQAVCVWPVVTQVHKSCMSEHVSLPPSRTRTAEIEEAVKTQSIGKKSALHDF